MEYETPDGSLFSLREVWSAGEEPHFEHTSVTAIIDGQPYAASIGQRVDEADLLDVSEMLVSVPQENIYPLFDQAWRRAPTFDPRTHYLKMPSFMCDDSRPGDTFVADCMRREIKVLEDLDGNGHPNLVKYYGCVVNSQGRVTHICLQKIQFPLFDYLDDFQPPDSEVQKMVDDVESAVKYLHSMGYAHNDINEQNIRIDEQGRAVLIDLDSCLPFGQDLMKGVGSGMSPISDARNDIRGLEDLARLLRLRNGRS